MAIPSGSGSEVLRNASINANASGSAKVDFGGATGTGTMRSTGNSSGVINVPTNVIITVLNITCTSNSNTHDISIFVDWQGAGTDIAIAYQKDLLVDHTFVFNDKIVLREGDELGLYNSASSCDWSVNFIYQDWT